MNYGVCMNKTYSIVWSHAKNMHVVASELASRKKSKGNKILKVAAIALSLPLLSVGGIANAALADDSIIVASNVKETEEYKELKRWLGIGNRWNNTKTSNAASLAEDAYNSMAIGWGARVNGAQSIAMGIGATIFSKTTNALALGTASMVDSYADNGIAIGYNAISRANDSLALGSNSHVSKKAISSIAIGNGSSVSEGASYSIVLGSGAKGSTDASIAIGKLAESSGEKSLAIGENAKAEDIGAIAIGRNAEAKANSSISIGNETKSGKLGVSIGYKSESAENSVALGPSAKATSVNSTAIGISSVATSAGATALGKSASAQGENSVAIGHLSIANEANTVSFGNETLKRKLSNIAPGQINKTSTDAINGSQLYATGQSVATALGGGAVINEDGTITAPTYTVGGEKVNDIGKAFSNVDSRITLNKVAIEKNETAIGKNTDNLGKLDEQVGKNTASLGDINKNVVDNTTNITKVTNGKAGLIKLDGQQIIVDNALAKEADVFNIAKADGEGRTLTGLVDGNVAKGSKDAVTGGQLFTVGTGVATALGGGAKFENGQLTGVDFKEALGADKSIVTVNDGFAHVKGEFDKTNKNVTDVTKALGDLETDGTWKLELGKEGSKATVTNVKDAFENIDGRVVSNSASIENIENKVSAGTLGLVQLAKSGVETEDGETQEVTTLVLDNEVAKEADVFNIAKADGEGRTLTGLVDGNVAKGSKDAVTGGQLFTVGTGVATALGGGAKFENGQLTGVDFKEALGADKSIVTVNDGFAHVKGEFDKTNKNVTDVTKALGDLETDGTWKLELGKEGSKATVTNVKDAFENIDGRVVSNSASIVNIENKVSAGTLGLVQLAKSGVETEDGETQEVTTLVLDNEVAKEADVFNIAKADGEGRTLTGLVDGNVAKGSKDAVTGGQLFTVGTGVATALGGGAKFENGQLTGVDFKEALGADKSIVTVNDGFAHVKGEFDKTNKNVTDVTKALGDLETDGTWKLELGKEGSKATVTNVKDAFENIDGRVVSNSASIVNIENKVSAGTLGLVQLAKSGVETADGETQEVTTLVLDNEVAKEADVFNIAKADGEGRTLTGLVDGNVAKGSKDAVTGGQLFTVGTGVATALGGGVKFENGQLTGVDFKEALGADKSIVTVNDGFAHVKGEFDKTNKNVADNAAVIKDINESLGVKEGEDTTVGEVIGGIKDDVSKVVAGKAGLIQLNDDSTKIIIDNDLAEKALTFDIAKAGGEGRTLTGLADGKIAKDSLDAINGSQLYSANQNVAKVLGGTSKFENGQLTGVDFSSAFTGLAEGEKIESVYGGFDKLDKRVDATSKVVDEINSGLGIGEDGESGSVGDVIGGIKDDVSNVVAGKVGLIQLNDDSTKLIIDNDLAEKALTFDIAKAGGESRTLTGLADGNVAKGSKDAVTGGQLFTVGTGVATALGGGAKFENGQLTGVDFKEALGADKSIVTVNDGFAHVKGEFDKTNKNVTDVTKALGDLETDGTWKLELGKEGSKATVTNVKDAFENIDGRVVSNSASIVNIENKVSAGTLGLVQLAKSRVETEDGETQEVTTLVLDNEVAKEADVFNIAKADGEGRTLTGLVDGNVAKGSKDAVTGGQLFTVGTGVATTLGGGAKFENGQLTGVDFKEALGADKSIVTVNDGFAHVKGEFDKTNKNVTDVTKALGDLETDGTWKLELGKEGSKATVTNVKDAFENIDGRVVSNSASIVNIENKVSAGTLGLVQLAKSGVETADGETQEVTTLVLDNEVAKEADVFNIAKADGEGRTLTGLVDGNVAKGSKDAVTGGQLFTVGTGVATALGGGVKFENGQLTGVDFKEALGADKSIVTVNDGFAHVKGEFDKTNKNVADNAAVIKDINESLGVKEGEDTTVGEVIGGIKDDVSKVVAGKAGLIQLNDDSTKIIIDNDLAEKALTFDIAKAGGEGRTLTGLADGKIAKDSLDAINGSQLYSANQNVAKVLGGDATFKDGQLTGVDFSGAFTGLAEGKKIESVYGGFDNLDKRVEATSKVVDEINSGLGIGEDGELGSVGDVIGGIKDDVSNVVAGRAGLIKLNDDGTQIIVDNKLAQEADVFNIAKADEKGRTLTGVKAGQIAQDSLDAINGSQLYSANQNVAKVLGGISKFENGQLTGVDFSSAFTGLAEGEKIESVYGGFDKLDKRVDATSKVVDEINSGLGIGEDGESGSVGDVIGGIKDDVSNVVAGRAGLIKLNDDGTQIIVDNKLAQEADVFNIAKADEKVVR